VTPALDVVVVSYRTRELLRACLRSLERRTQANQRVVVVDNASGDGSVELVAAEFPDVDLVAAPRNLGFAAAANTGIARGHAPYVLVLNPDTEVPPETLDTLLALMEQQPDVGICGCKLVRPDGRLDHAARRSFPTIAGALGHFTGVGRTRRAPRTLAQYRAPDVDAGPVDAVNGAFMLIRRVALEQVGAFDERYWMYMEDLDLCFRFAEAGWVTWYEPSVSALHVKAAASGHHRSPRLTLAFHSGMARFYRTHVAPRRNPLVNAVVYGGIATKLAVSLVRNTAARAIART
jgi:N-acetylglucosaminyl-diphospho-decaprenol L-rhamnosyltransferase